MKKTPSDWEEVSIENAEVYRDGGTTNYYFNGKEKEYDKIYISSPIQKNEACYLLINSESVSLKKILLSKEKLNEVGITNIIELDCSNIPETIAEAEHQHAKRTKKFRRRLDFLAPDFLDKFFDGENLSADLDKEVKSSEKATVLKL